MPTNTEARKARERKLRAKYRKKTAVTAAITLLVGLIIGFVLCAVMVSKPGPISRMLKVGPLDQTPAAIEDSGALTPEEDESFGPTGDEDFAPEDEGDFATEDEGDFAVEDEGDFAAEDEEDFAPEDEGDFAPEEDAEDFAPEGESEEDADLAEGEPAALNGADEAEPDATPMPTITPTPEPTPEPTPAPQIIPFGQPCVIQTEVYSDGSKRVEADDQPFETLNFTLKMDAYKSPSYFQETYATQYKLNGDEAAAQFDITLNGYNGTLEVIPQDVLLITFMGETPDITDEGYQLMDAEIAGKTGIVIAPNTTTTLYKRYSYSAAVGDMKYLVVTTYNGGEPTSYWLEIQAPQPVVTAVPEGMEGEVVEGESTDGGAEAAASVDGLTIGSEGEEVSRLQRALIAKGLLQGSPDGKFGNYTADAVKMLQDRYGMPKTGVADQAFLNRLYSDQ